MQRLRWTMLFLGATLVVCGGLAWWLRPWWANARDTLIPLAYPLPARLPTDVFTRPLPLPPAAVHVSQRGITATYRLGALPTAQAAMDGFTADLQAEGWRVTTDRDHLTATRTGRSMDRRQLHQRTLTIHFVPCSPEWCLTISDRMTAQAIPEPFN